MIKFVQDVALNHVGDKGKPWCKLSYKALKQEDGYDSWLEISPYQTLIPWKDILDGIPHCDKVLGKWIFGGNYPFARPLTKDNLGYCCINDNETKEINGYAFAVVEKMIQETFLPHPFF